MQFNNEKSLKNVDVIKKFTRSSIAGVIIAFLLVFVIMAIASGDTFLSQSNMINIIRQSVVLSIVAIGQTFVIITGGIDLSVAPLISMSSVLTASMITNGHMNWLLACVLAILACAGCGLLNGSLITFVKIPPIIATLATSMAYQGFCLLYTQGYGINLPAESQLSEILGRGKLLDFFPISGIVMVFMYALFYIILRYTKLGRVTYGLGGNAEAVYLSGISIRKYRVIIYTLCGMLAGFAGVMLTGRINTGHSYNGQGFDMDSIAASVLGGVSVAGGVGSIWGALLGVLVLTIITNGLNMINMNTYVQMMIKGLIIVIAIGIGSLREIKK